MAGSRIAYLIRFGFEELVDLGIGEGGVGPEIDARDLAPIARHDRLEHALPAVGAVHVAGTQRAAFQIAELVEHEQRMIAGAGVMAVPDAHLLLAMGRADARIHVEHDASRRTAAMHAVDPLAGQDRRAPRGSSAPRASASRSAPSGSAMPHGPEPPCRRRSSASPDHGAGARRRSRPRIRQAARTPTAAATRPAHGGRSCRCARRRASRPPSRSDRARRRVRGRPAIRHRR